MPTPCLIYKYCIMPPARVVGWSVLGVCVSVCGSVVCVYKYTILVTCGLVVCVCIPRYVLEIMPAYSKFKP
jgi:hypothetical protein